MKKLLVLLMLVFSLGGLMQQIEAEEASSDIYLHYYRYNADYSGWAVWGWQNEPTGEDGSSFGFVEDNTAAEYNYGGVVAVINIADNFPDITKMGLIINKNSWAEKDISSDRFITIPATSDNGDVHYYLVEGDTRIGTSLTDLEGPDRYPKFKSAYFTEMNTISFSATETITSTNIKVYADDILVTIDSVIIDGTDGTVVISENLDFSKKWVIEATFTSDGSTNTYDVTFDGIYDSEAFETAFSYDGELGAIINGNSTTFRIWAPISESVTLNLYNTGTNLSDGGTDTPTGMINMTAGEKGTFYYTTNENLHGTYYTYSVTNGGITSEVVDPYAKSTGINGYRGLAVDFTQMNPDGFEYDTRADNMTNLTDAIIYELHIRDLTTSDTWNGTEVNRGKYLGLIEEGTTYNNATTGFDHLKELGVTHVQLLPFFDYGVVDETRLDDEDYNSFNWGYMPLNFNALEGTYSADPYDGLTRINEMKEVVTAFTEANMRINMDVVYNHTGLSADSNFNLIVPGYYYRLTSNGSFSNGSGTGNETASERVMMRKFMVDSTVFWATEYNISGFRFDLMALHDVDTMELIASELHAIDPTIMVYGEPWTGGTSPLPSSETAGKQNLANIEGVGAFNDDTRDGIKGSVFQKEGPGFIQGSYDNTNKVKYGIVGGIDYPEFTYSTWHTSPTKTINYVACHDNNTLYDKLYQTLEHSEEYDLILPYAKQAYAIILTSQGIPFIHAGDEFLRSKPAVNGNGFDHNSYESPDSVNQIDWSLKTSEDGAEMYDYVSYLIELRKTHSSFRMSENQDIIDNLTFLNKELIGVITYTLTNNASTDTTDEFMIIHNARNEDTKFLLPLGGGWTISNNGTTGETADTTVYTGGGYITVSSNTTFILEYNASYTDEDLEMLFEDSENIVAYTYTVGELDDDDFSKILVIENNNDTETILELPKNNGWTITLGEDTEPTIFEGKDLITIPANTTYILVFDPTIGSGNITTIILSIVGGIAVLTAGAFIVITQLKKK